MHMKRYSEPQKTDFLLESSAMDPRFGSLPGEREEKKQHSIYTSIVLKVGALHQATTTQSSVSVKLEPADDTV